MATNPGGPGATLLLKCSDEGCLVRGHNPEQVLIVLPAFFGDVTEWGKLATERRGAVQEAGHVLHVLIDPLVPEDDAALIAGVPPELLPPAEGPVPDWPRWAGRPPKRREQGDSYRWLCYQDGYRAAARHRGYRVVNKPVLPAQLQTYQDSLDRLAATATPMAWRPPPCGTRCGR
jgi:hypothetical protein